MSGFPKRRPPEIHSSQYSWSVLFDCRGMRREDVKSQMRNHEIVVWASYQSQYKKHPPPSHGCSGVNFYEAVSIPRDVNLHAFKSRWISRTQLQYIAPKGNHPRGEGDSETG
ncbi:uncharacterized protein LOC142356729 [Convolutriloba macropyga]|uniref:uncharacterized protein LOC142356729 n=1 Tax=Convolutriloba macropyga TaxID=536237 RepID=UPI003F523B12